MSEPAEVLPLKLPLPAYTAVIERAPTMRAEVLSVAWVPLRVAVPNVVVPSLNVTEPVGVPDAATVAVRVTLWPQTLGFWEDATVTVVDALFTV